MCSAVLPLTSINQYHMKLTYRYILDYIWSNSCNISIDPLVIGSCALISNYFTIWPSITAL